MAHRLTVALPTYNGLRHLQAAIGSILSQTDQDFDLIVCDDRSDDESVKLIRQLAGDRAQIFANSERLGLAGNWNRCAGLAKTPWVNIFHQDDVMHPDHVARHQSEFETHERLGMIASAAAVIDDEGRGVAASIVGRGGLGDRDEVFPAGTLLPKLAAENPFRCSAVSLRVQALQDVGGFDPSYRYVVDWDCWIRLARRWGVAWVAKPTIDMRWHPASETHRFKVGTEDLDETLRLLGGMDRGGSRTRANRRLSRAFLNRAYEASKMADFALGRRCLRRSIGLWPGILGRILVDPRLVLRMLRMFGRG